MIIYDNRDVRFILFRKAGSVLVSGWVLGPAFLSTVVCFLGLWQANEKVLLSSSVARIYATILGFVIVFRTSMAFGRFFEGIAHVQMMFSKWRDAFSSLTAFYECSISHMARRKNTAIMRELLLSKARLLHWFSLLAALSVQELQMNAEMREGLSDDGSLGNADDHPEEVSRVCVLQCPTNYFRRDETNPHMRATGLGRHLERNSAKGDDLLQPSEPKFGELHRQTSMDKLRFLSNMQFQHTSQNLEGHQETSRESGLDMRRGMSDNGPTERRRRRAVYVVGNITSEELEQLDCAQDHVLTVVKWILLEISQHQISGKLLIAPPILSRVYSELSNGMLAFFMAKMKISMVPFPFPFAQVVSYALYAFYFFCPFIILEVTRDQDDHQLANIGVPLLLNFAACMGYAAVNEIAIEMEEPFGFDVNDYPVHCQQNLIVRAMEDTFFCEAPTDFTLALFEGRVSGEEAVERASSLIVRAPSQRLEACDPMRQESSFVDQMASKPPLAVSPPAAPTTEPRPFTAREAAAEDSSSRPTPQSAPEELRPTPQSAPEELTPAPQSAPEELRPAPQS